ncbi:HAD-IA family hydrolase [Microbacterium rhizophilus]|uniref:HAD-IA family hydrolase n=1 Tax=Microbacterium rhizophilus TaxID=3138934 RepID=UPI0031EB6F01
MPTLIFDCDGVLADTEMHGHLPAFNQAFEELGVPIHWSVDVYGEKVKIGGGKERMRSEFTPELAARWDGYPATDAEVDELILALHRRKTDIYTDLVDRGRIEPRPGIGRIAREAHDAGWRLAVASTSAEPSVRAVLRRAVGDDLYERFAVFAGDIVPEKKPAPDIYLRALEDTGTDASDAVVVEDSGIGVRAARAAGIATVVTVSAYTGDDDFTGAALVLPDLGSTTFDQIETVLATARRGA